VTQSSFNYKISQVRSGGTALGKVKFIFANKYSIYFHDTPSKRLFKNDIRAYSHGCVRVQNPLDLAQYILGRQDSVMTMDSVSNFTKRGIQKRINLTYNMPVYLRYYSCEGTSNGQMKFYRDIYKKETKVKMAIENLIAENQNKKTL
jgi:murein L,D-transpeptidase YcbB/YkuD